MPLLIKTKSTRIGESDMISVEFYSGVTTLTYYLSDTTPLREMGKLIVNVTEWEVLLGHEKADLADVILVDDGVDEVLESLKNKPNQP